MTFLDKAQHEKWLSTKFPGLNNKLYGQPADYNSNDAGKKIGDFPIIDSVYKKTNKHIFSAIIKLTTEEIPSSYVPTEEEREFGSDQQATPQILIIRVDKNLNFVDKKHFPLSSTRIS